jgi:hypothetical protein
MTTLTPLSIDELMAWTGDGPRTIRRLVREGQLPGTVDKIGRYRCTPKDALEWREGRWTPKPTAQPVAMLHRKAS